MYDIIGDVHGEADKLIELLESMGYSQVNGIYCHPKRKAVFVGDFINRGPKIRKTIRIIRAMVETDCAYAILGNHEVNAIYYSSVDKQGMHLSKRWSRLHLSLANTLYEFSGRSDEWKSHIKWMRKLPMFLDLGKIRVVHACWQDENIQILKENLPETKLKKSVLKMVGRNHSEVARAFWETCKGIDFHLPKDLLVYDNKGRAHRSFRSKWWVNPDGMTLKDFLLRVALIYLLTLFRRKYYQFVMIIRKMGQLCFLVIIV